MNRRRGQGVVEYGMTLGLIAVVAIASLTAIGQTVDKILEEDVRNKMEIQKVIDPELREAMKQSHRVDAGRRRFEIWKIAFDRCLENDGPRSHITSLSAASVIANDAMKFLDLEIMTDKVPYEHMWEYSASVNASECIECSAVRTEENMHGWCNDTGQPEKSAGP